MRTRTCAIIALACFAAAFPSACTTTMYTSDLDLTSLAAGGEYLAAVFPPVQVFTSQGAMHTGKITALGKDFIRLRPEPYWNAEPVSIPLDDVHMIKLLGVRKRAGGGFMDGAAGTFIGVGILGLATSKYDVDYGNWLVGSAVSALAGGLIGLLVGAIRDTGTQASYDLSQKSAVEKSRIILGIMGVGVRVE